MHRDSKSLCDSKFTMLSKLTTASYFQNDGVLRKVKSFCFVVFLPFFRNNRQVGTVKGGTAKCVRGRASGATVHSGHELRVSLCLTVGRRRFDTYQNRFGYISDTYQFAPALCLEAVPKGYPPGRYPPYDYSSCLFRK